MKMKNLYAIIIALVIFTGMGLSSCCSNKLVSGNKTVAIESNSWKLVSMNGEVNKAFAEGDRFTIEFIKKDGKIAGVGACNRFFGAYKIEKSDAIKINMGGSTMMACPNMELEQPFFAMLDSADRYVIKGDVLELYKSNQKIAEFSVAKKELKNTDK